MRPCKDCKIILDDDARFCPKCGKAVDPSISSDPGGLDLPALLTSANLHRIRAEWDEAIGDATEALRLDPKNPDIASLIAGIYEERGMLDEAVIWYQMALELNPDSTVDKARLDKVSGQIAAKRKQGSTDSFRIFEKRTKLWAGVLGSVFVLIVVFGIVMWALHGKTSNSAPPATHPRATRAEATTPPINEPISGVPAPRGTASTGSARNDAAAPQAATALRTPAEAYIRGEVSAAQTVTSTGASVDDVVADPRVGVAIVTFSVPVKGVVTKDQITRAAAAIAVKTFATNREVKFVTARCLVSIGGPQDTQIAFVGDIARVNVDQLGPNATEQQYAQAFTRAWWNPQIR